jgi:hypothetical protein
VILVGLFYPLTAFVSLTCHVRDLNPPVIPSVERYDQNTITLQELEEEAKKLGFLSVGSYSYGIIFVTRDGSKYTTGYYYSRDLKDVGDFPGGSGQEPLGEVYKNFVKIRIKKRKLTKVAKALLKKREAMAKEKNEGKTVSPFQTGAGEMSRGMTKRIEDIGQRE